MKWTFQMYKEVKKMIDKMSVESNVMLTTYYGEECMVSV